METLECQTLWDLCPLNKWDVEGSDASMEAAGCLLTHRTVSLSSPLPLSLLVNIKETSLQKQTGRASISSVSWPGLRQASGTAAGSLMSRSNNEVWSWMRGWQAAVCCMEAERLPCCTMAEGTTAQVYMVAFFFNPKISESWANEGSNIIVELTHEN